MGSLLAYENEFGIIMVSSYTHEAHVSKNIHFPYEFKGFLEGIIPMCDHFEATLVSHWALGDPFGVTLGHFGVTLGPPLGDCWTFGLTLESLWSHLRHMRGNLGRPYVPRKSLWAHFGATLIRF